MKINNVNVKMQLDTDSDITIINKATWKANRKSILKRTLKIECDMLGKKLYFIGEMICNISFHNKCVNAKAYVLEILQTYSVLIGLNYLSCGIYL